MIFNIYEARQNDLRKGLTKEANRVIAESARTPLDTQWDVFLSYSSRDRYAMPYARERLEDDGLDVYVDAIADADLDPANVTVSTADRLRTRLENCKALLVLTSENVTMSRWVPWELGFADGNGKRVAVFPYRDQRENAASFVGSEYLGLYPYIDDVPDTKGVQYLWARQPSAPSTCCRLDRWIEGQELKRRPKLVLRNARR